MRRMTLAIAVVAAIAASYMIGRHGMMSQTAGNSGPQVLYYVDPMHPSYKSDKPGIAPDCGMKLVPVYVGELGKASSSSPDAQLPAGSVNIDASTQHLLGIRVAAAEKSGTKRMIRAVGRVVPEDSRVFKLNSGVDGFVRETYEDSVGMMVKKDQKLASYYAPDFVAAASGFLAAVQSVPGAVGQDGARFTPSFPGALAKEGVRSMSGYTDRLRNLGMSDEQIKRVADTRQLPDSIDVVSPTDGFVLARNISAGQHFDHMLEFYRIADLTKVWVVAEVYEQDAPNFRPGAMAMVGLKAGGHQMSARVTDSLPESEAGGGTVKLRLEVENPGFMLRPEMLVDVEMAANMSPTITVPVDALVDSGAHARVYVEHGEGVFEPREVETGWRSSDRVEILQGLAAGERVVVEATFLVDSESRMKSPSSSSAPGHSVDKPEVMPGHDHMAAAIQ